MLTGGAFVGYGCLLAGTCICMAILRVIEVPTRLACFSAGPSLIWLGYIVQLGNLHSGRSVPRLMGDLFRVGFVPITLTVLGLL
jgi:hypothetical protein